jgi:hypothetical protein
MIYAKSLTLTCIGFFALLFAASDVSPQTVSGTSSWSVEGCGITNGGCHVEFKTLPLSDKMFIWAVPGDRAGIFNASFINGSYIDGGWRTIIFTFHSGQNSETFIADRETQEPSRYGRYTNHLDLSGQDAIQLKKLLSLSQYADVTIVAGKFTKTMRVPMDGYNAAMTRLSGMAK